MKVPLSDVGVPVGHLDRTVPQEGLGSGSRKHNISDVTFHRWKRKYGGMPTSEVARIKALEKENQQLKQLAGDQALAIQVMKEELKKRGWA